MPPTHPNDKFGIDYAEIVDMAIATPGPINWFYCTAEILREVASSYDSKFYSAPLVLDHIMEGPAHGWILDLWVEDGEGDQAETTLWARVGLLESGKAEVESGAWPERSIYFLNFHPMEGVWYLNHLSLLGAANPAVPGLDPVDITEMTEAALIDMGFNEPMMRLVATTAQRMHTWAKDDQYITYRLRPISRFKGELRTVGIDTEKGIFARVGKLKVKYVPEGSEADADVTQALMFEVDKWNVEKAKKYVQREDRSLKSQLDEFIILQEIAVQGDTEINDNPIAKAKGGSKPMPPTETEIAAAAEAKKAEEAAAAAAAEAEALKAKEAADAAAAKKTVETPSAPIPVLVESGSIQDLEAVNKQLQADLLKANAEALDLKQLFNEQLSADAQTLKHTIISTKVQRLLADGFLVPAQVNFGLVEALAAIPDDAVIKIEGKDIHPRDALLEILKHGGQLKLKGELAPRPRVAGQRKSSDRLDVADAQGFDTSVLRKKQELEAENLKRPVEERWDATKILLMAKRAVKEEEGDS